MKQIITVLSLTLLSAPTYAQSALAPSNDDAHHTPMAQHSLPDRMEYIEGEPLPEGYRLEATPRYGLIVGGSVVTGVAWIGSLVTAIALDREKDKTTVDSQGGRHTDPEFGDNYWPMFIPVIGPALAIPTSHAKGTGAAILALDSVVQGAGLAMFIAGLAWPHYEVVKKPTYQLGVAPMAEGDARGVSLSATF